MIKTSEELRSQVKEKGITKWNLHNCSFCSYSCGYRFRGDRVYYDNGCGCSWAGESDRGWDDVAEAFNQNQPENNPDFAEKHPEEYKKHYAVWEFN